ncbi:MAG: hypothetical protein KDC60_06795, partial [Bacteroidetes bacterium]|nr:hypothetical protein [Bacteroidota bacterium]
VVAQVPVKQKVKIQGELEVPVNQQVSIPLKKLITAPVTQSFTADVQTLNNNIQTAFNSGLKTTAKFDKPLRVSGMDSLIIDPSKIEFQIKK